MLATAANGGPRRPGNGIILDMSTLQPKRVLLHWRFVPVAVGTRAFVATAGGRAPLTQRTPLPRSECRRGPRRAQFRCKRT